VSLDFLKIENVTIGEKWKVTEAMLENCIICSTYAFSDTIGQKKWPYPRCQGQSCSCQSNTVGKELKSREKAPWFTLWYLPLERWQISFL